MCSKLCGLACVLPLVLAACAASVREAEAPSVPVAAAPPAPSPGVTPQAREPTGPRRGAGGPSAADPEQLRAHVGRVLELAAAFAEARDRTAARTTAAEALHALADAIQVAPAPFSRARVAALAWDVRSDAERLERADDLSLQRSDLARGGLLAATRALEQLAAPRPGSFQARLLVNARRAARAIDVHSPFVFERARIQDALRATADAYLVFAERARPTTIGRR